MAGYYCHDCEDKSILPDLQGCSLQWRGCWRRSRGRFPREGRPRCLPGPDEPAGNRRGPARGRGGGDALAGRDPGPHQPPQARLRLRRTRLRRMPGAKTWSGLSVRLQPAADNSSGGRVSMQLRRRLAVSRSVHPDADPGESTATPPMTDDWRNSVRRHRLSVLGRWRAR